MSQVSRPFQIALAAVLLFAVAWFAVLRQHATAGSEPGSSPSLSAPSTSAPSTSPGAPSQSATGQSQSTPSSAASQAREAAKPTHVYKGSAPGVEGLTRDVHRAHEAVGKSNANASATERASAGVSGEARTGAAATSHGRASGRASNPSSTSKSTPSSTSKSTPSSTSASRTSSAGASNGGSAARGATQAHPSSSPATRIAAQLKHGKTVLLLFWNPKSSTNTTVREQVSNAARSLGGNVAVTYAKADEVGAFGTITRSVTVNQTPTLLIIGKKGLISTITGLTDAFAIEQAVREARS